MYGYKAFYKGRVIEVQAETSYAAQRKAAKIFGVRENKAYQVAIVLVEKPDGTEVKVSTASLG